MSDSIDPRCFTCRQPVGDPPILNRGEDGELCPTCRERVLDSLPTLLPSSPVDVEVEAESDVDEAPGPRSLVLVDAEEQESTFEADDPPQPA